VSEPVPVSGKAKAWAIVVYSLLRLALLLAIWVVVELTTPFHGMWALVIALLVSGAISLLVLDRQRDAVSVAVGGVFSRINARIDAASRSEDVDELETSTSGDAEQRAEDDSVGKQ
jgi:hypothetical protein